MAKGNAPVGKVNDNLSFFKQIAEKEFTKIVESTSIRLIGIDTPESKANKGFNCVTKNFAVFQIFG